MDNFYLISHHGYDVEKLTAPGSSNLNFLRAEKKICVKKMSYMLFYSIKCKVFSRIVGGRVTFQ